MFSSTEAIGTVLVSLGMLATSCFFDAADRLEELAGRIAVALRARSFRR